MEDVTLIQWHPAFVSAMEEEFQADQEKLYFDAEYNIGKKPLEIDLLIIKKKRDAVLQNEIGLIFSEYNIVEYKSPDDSLNIDDFYKAQAYGGLYKAGAKRIDAIKTDSISITLVRSAYPRELFRDLRQQGFIIENHCQGIYYITGSVLFRTQIVVTSRLNEERHIWLSVLKRKIEHKTLLQFIKKVNRLTEKVGKDNAESVLSVVMQANREKLQMLKEDESMYKSLEWLMEPELNEREQRGIIESAIEFGIPKQDIMRRLIKRFELTEDEAEQIYERYATEAVS